MICPVFLSSLKSQCYGPRSLCSTHRLSFSSGSPPCPFLPQDLGTAAPSNPWPSGPQVTCHLLSMALPIYPISWVLVPSPYSQLSCVILSCFNSLGIFQITFFTCSLLPQECQVHQKRDLGCLGLCYSSELEKCLPLVGHWIDTCWIFTSLTVFSHSSKYNNEFDAVRSVPSHILGSKWRNFSQRTFLVWPLPPSFSVLFDGCVLERITEHFWLLEWAYLLNSDTLCHSVLFMGLALPQ